MEQMLIRAPKELKTEVTNEAKRIGISTNALLLQILDDWRRRQNEDKEIIGRG